MSLLKNISFIIAFVFSCIIANAEENRVNMKIGDKAPDFTITDPSGKSISLSSLKGKLILLDFWASWCGYCKIANEEFIPIYNKYKPQGFEIFSVSLDAKKEAWTNAIKNQKLPWPLHGSELKGWEASKISEIYGVEVLPSTFLIDEHGNIIAMDLDEYDLDKKLNWYYNEQVHFYPYIAISKIYFTGKVKFDIADAKGQIVLKGKDMEVDISGLSPGEYSVIYESKTEKFIKRNNTQPPVTFFPERVDDKITFSRETEYEIYNQSGRVIKKGKCQLLDVAELQSGVYYLCLDGNVHNVFKK